MLKMETEYDHGILFVRLKGILNRRSSYKINNYINPVLKKHNIKYLVYNFEYLTGVDNAGIDALLNSKNILKKQKGKLRVCVNNINMKKICRALNLSILKNESEAFKLMEMI